MSNKISFHMNGKIIIKKGEYKNEHFGIKTEIFWMVIDKNIVVIERGNANFAWKIPFSSKKGEFETIKRIFDNDLINFESNIPQNNPSITKWPEGYKGEDNR